MTIRVLSRRCSATGSFSISNCWLLRLLLLVSLGWLLASPLVAAAPLSLELTVERALDSDPWLAGSRYREEALRARSVAAGELPDPSVSLDVANLPVDSLDFQQEPMTQLRVGARQMFPQGDSRTLRRRQLEQLGDRHPLQRADRRAQVQRTVTQLWLDAYRYRETIRLIEQDRALFEHLVDVAESSYTAAAGNASQQDLVRARLELTRLEDRLTMLEEQRQLARARLSEWLVQPGAERWVVGDRLPALGLREPALADPAATPGRLLYRQLLEHPHIRSLQQSIEASATGVELARQQYKPQWGLNASYGYRDEDPLGATRSDFFSVGVTVELPLFTADRQDREVAAAVASAAAVKTDRALALRKMQSQMQAARARLLQLNRRKALYEERLLEEVHDQAEASLAAYTNDTGDFAEVVRARIAELNANIDYLDITVDRLKTIAALNYFLVPPAGTADPGESR